MRFPPRYRRWGAVMVCAAAFLGAAAPARAQSYTRSIVFDDYGFTERFAAGARGAGLAGAYTSSANDVHSLVFNPAGLARIKRFELALGLQQERVQVDNTFFGSPMSVERNDGGIEALALAVPLPAYRGSFVVAFGVYRVYSAHMDMHYRGLNAESDNATLDDYFLQQTGSIYSYNLGMGVDLSPALSGGISLFVVDGTVDALSQFDYEFVDPSPVQAVYVTDESTFDVDGYGARVGAQLYFDQHLRAAFCFQTPTLIRTNGDTSTEITEDVINGVDTFRRFEGVEDTDYVLPYRMDVGVASTWRDLTVTAEITYADWTQASIDRKRLRGRDLEPVFKEVVDYRGGAEWVVAGWPMRLRAGYAYRPYPLRYLQGDRIDNDSFERVAVDHNRHVVAVGAGALVGRVMTVDVAYERTTGTRSLPTLSDERVRQRYVLSASYRF